MSDPFSKEKNREHIKALWDAYFEATELPELKASHPRIMALKELDKRGVTAADVRGVIAGLKRAIAKGGNGFTENSLDWSNTLGNVDRFEERVLRYRQAVQRRRGAKREAVEAAPRPAVRKLPDGSTLNVLEAQPKDTFVPPLKSELSRIVEEKLKGGNCER